MDLAGFNTNYLVVFEAIYRTRSVTRAARELGMTQSGASNALAQLRLLFEDSLFDRSAQGLVPTALAERIAPDILSGIASLSRALTPSGFDPKVLDRTLTVAMPDYVQMVCAESIVQQFFREASMAHLRIKTTSAHEIPAGIMSGHVDAYVGFCDRVSKDCVANTLYEDDFVLLMRSKHPARVSRKGSEPLPLRDWISYGHVVVSSDPESQTLIDRALSEKGLGRRVAMVVDAASMVPLALRRSDLIAAVGRSWAERVARGSAGKLVTAACPLQLPPSRIRLVVHRRRGLDPAVEWLQGLIERSSGGERLREAAKDQADKN